MDKTISTAVIRTPHLNTGYLHMYNICECGEVSLYPRFHSKNFALSTVLLAVASAEGPALNFPCTFLKSLKYWL